LIGCCDRRRWRNAAHEVTVRRPSSWRRAKQRTRLGRRSSRATGRVRVRIDPHYFGPTEVDRLIAVPSKTWRKLDWRHRVSFDNLGDEDIARMREAKVPIKCMIETDVRFHSGLFCTAL
jgi:GDP-D-mannose dehydratase